MILDKICREKLAMLKLRKEELPLDYIKKKINTVESEETFRKALERDGISIIGEAKKASPSKGIIKKDFDIEKIIKSYDGMDEIRAISVLTEENYFKGSLENLKKAKLLTKKPILRKDFIIDIYELYESKFYLADGVLLITAVLEKKLDQFYKVATEIGLEPLVEVHDERELEIALNIGAKIIGINNRNLKTFNVDIKTTERLKRIIPKDRIVVSESGIGTREDIEYISSLAVDGLLIGEYFMRQEI